VHGKETSRSTGKAPAALFFDDTSGLNSLRCDSISLLETNYQSEKIVMNGEDYVCLCFLSSKHRVCYIKIWWLTTRSAYLGYII
ncbi:unnamed protein product, partial [Brassica oleracea]